MKVKACRVRIKIFKDIGIAINFDVLLNPIFEITTCYNIARNYSQQKSNLYSTKDFKLSKLLKTILNLQGSQNQFNINFFLAKLFTKFNFHMV